MQEIPPCKELIQIIELMNYGVGNWLLLSVLINHQHRVY